MQSSTVYDPPAQEVRSVSLAARAPWRRRPAVALQLAAALIRSVWLGASPSLAEPSPGLSRADPTAPAKRTLAAQEADCAFLRRHYTAPQGPGESNHYLDLWGDQSLRTLMQAAGLTNNHALFINSHGEVLIAEDQAQYVFRPHESLLRPGQPVPCYRAEDLARFLGPEAVGQIHNVVVAGCNLEGAFDATELRRHFPQATNVVYCPPGQLGYQPLFQQAVLLPSLRVQTFYELSRPSRSGQPQYFLRNRPTREARRLVPYLAELYLPGARTPYRLQVAGRELLDPSAAAGALAGGP